MSLSFWAPPAPLTIKKTPGHLIEWLLSFFLLLFFFIFLVFLVPHPLVLRSYSWLYDYSWRRLRGSHMGCQGSNPSLTGAKQAPTPLCYFWDPNFCYPVGTELFFTSESSHHSSLSHLPFRLYSAGLTPFLKPAWTAHPHYLQRTRELVEKAHAWRRQMHQTDLRANLRDKYHVGARAWGCAHGGGRWAKPCGRVLTRVPVRNKSWPLRVRAGRRPARPSPKVRVPDSITVPGPQAGCLRGARTLKGIKGSPHPQPVGARTLCGNVPTADP